MIVRRKLNWWRMLFVWRESLLKNIIPQLLLVLLISVVAVITHGHLLRYGIQLSVAPFTLLGVSLALFLGFRNSASYERFWEGRRLWGSALNVSRSLARQAIAFTTFERESAEISYFVSLLIAFVHSLRHQLRGTDAQADLQRLLPPDACRGVIGCKYKPVAIVQLLAQWINERYREQQFGEGVANSFDTNLNNLLEILGGCERLANTPLPFAYAVMIHRIVYLYCLLLPFGLVESIGFTTPLFSVFVAYTFIGVDYIGDEIEEPFGTAPNDLALDAMSRNIEESLREMMGQRTPENLPEKELGYILT